MTIRQLAQEHFEERIALSEFAFQYKLPEDRKEMERRYFRPAEQFGAFDEQGKLQSGLMLLPLEIWVHGRKLQMGGVAGVATWPEARRHGYVAKLLVHALEKMREQGQSVSMLYPFAYPFYRKYGWEMTLERKQYDMETRQIPKVKPGQGTVERITPNAGIIDPAYETYAAAFTGTLVRDEEWWTRRRFQKTGQLAVYSNVQGVIEGYVHYQIENRIMTVHEWVSNSEEANTGLWHYIGNHDSMMDRLKLTVPIDDTLPFLLADPRIKQEIEPYMMSRIVDVQAFIPQYSFLNGDKEERLTVNLTDEHAPWNTGVFELVWATDGTASFNRITNDQAQLLTADILCDIQTWTALLLSSRRASFLQQTGRLNGSAEAVQKLEQRIPVRTPYLMDFF